MDLFNGGEIIGFSISRRPTLSFAMASLEQVFPMSEAHAHYCPTIYLDHGWYYQYDSWMKNISAIRFSKACREGRHMQTMRLWQTSSAYRNRRCITGKDYYQMKN